jgi:hypothetical protein
MRKTLLRTAGIIAIPAVAVLALTGCGNTIDPDQIEPQILSNVKSVYSELDLEATEATCPSGVEAKVDQTFDCTVTIDGNSDTVVTGTVTSIEGNVFNFDIAVKSAYIPMAPIEKLNDDAFIESFTSGGGDADAIEFATDCGDQEVFNTGDTFTCTYVYNDVEVGTVEYTVKGGTGEDLLEEGEANLDEAALEKASE